MFTGGYMCGALRYRAEGVPKFQGLCHCRNCQRLSGAGHVGWLCFDEAAVTVEGETRVYATIGGSGQKAKRFSCPTCHSIVYGTGEVMPGLVNFYAGSLDDTAQFRPTMAIFTRSRPAWDDSSRNLVCFETLPQGPTSS